MGVVGELDEAGDRKGAIGKLNDRNSAMAYIKMCAEDGEGDIEKAA